MVSMDESSLSRKIRIQGLIDDSVDIENTIQSRESILTLKKIRDIIISSNEILEEADVQDRAQHTTEVVLDAQLLKMNQEIVGKVMQTHSEFDEIMYTTAINRVVFRGDEPNWMAIANIAVKMALTSRTKSTMYGSLDVVVKETQTKERQRRQKSQMTQEVQPEKIKQLQRSDKGHQKVNIVCQQLAQILSENDRQPIPFYKLVIDPNSLMNTIENAFQLSFLARDGIIAIEIGDDNFPEVRLALDRERRCSESKQSICMLNDKICKEMISFYRITEPMLDRTMLE